MPRRQQQDCDAIFADKRTVSEPPAKRGTHLKRQRKSRPLSDTETTQNPGKTTVSSLLKHRDHTKSRKNHSLVPSPTPRLHKTPEKQQSRPFSSTETAQNPEKQQSRPFSSTETAQNPGKTAVSSLLRHRDCIKPQKNSSLVPSQAPRPHKIPEKQQSRPFSSTETAQNPRKTAVSSPLRHRDHTKPQKNDSLVPSQAPRPHTTEGREGWDSYYVLQGRGGKRRERWGWAASQGRGRKRGERQGEAAAQGRGGEEGRRRGRGQNGRSRTQ